MDETEWSEIVIDFGKICRLCLTSDGVLINLYSKNTVLDVTGKSIPERIAELMSIQILNNDGFPSWICHNCLSQVDKCYEFFEMCKTSQATLKESYISALSEVGINVTVVKNEELDIGKKKTGSQEVTIFNSEEGEIKEEMISSNVKEEVDAIVPILPSNYCSDCCKMFADSEEFRIHRVSIHHDDLITDSNRMDPEVNQAGVWTCDLCGAKFHKKTAIVTHIRFQHLKSQNDPEIEYKKLIFCKYCGLSFRRKNLTRHLEVVHRISKYAENEQTCVDCQICFRPFMRHSSLRTHAKKYHGDNLEVIAEAENCEIVWNCSECDSTFLKESLLFLHYGNKHSKYPLEMEGLRGLKSRNLICDCGAIATNSFDAALHKTFYHREENISQETARCPGCDETFPNVEELKIHLVSYHWFMTMSYENECVFCNLAFTSNEMLRLHLNENHDVNLEKDPLDEGKAGKKKQTEEQSLTIEDMKLEEEEPEPEQEEEVQVQQQELFSCQICGEFFKTEEEMAEHGKDCEALHICELCGKGYKTDNHLKRHITDYHKTISPIRCPVCPKVFPRKMNLHNHYQRRHLKQAKKFVCSYCGQSLKGRVALRSHEDRLHRNIRIYKCSECPEAFTTKSILLKHAQRHMTERPMLQCQYCERKFSTISGIERHVKTHEGVKDFTCELLTCRKSFYTKSELKRHMKFHTRDFKHACQVCNHKFMSPGELKKHSTKHTGERPYKCHLCPCTYARRDDKVKHLKKVHNLRVKRVYGKPLRKYSDEDTEVVDTIVIDESSEGTESKRETPG